MIVFKKRFLTVGELHFGGEPGRGWTAKDFPGVDALTVLQSPERLPGASCVASVTLVNDLRQDLETLKAGLNKTNRYEINRAAEKDALEFRCWDRPDAATIGRFRDFFSEFAASKGILGVTRDRLEAYARAGGLVLTETLSPEQVTLTWHAYFRARGRVRLLHSASRRLAGDPKFRQLVGRANRYHHWKDFERFKADSEEVYDWGGIYLGDDDPEKARITEFKRWFGGTEETNYNCELALTPRGRAYYLLRRGFYGLRSKVSALRVRALAI